jgi:uncharacterized protein YdbL (DUF1318 family)
MRNFTKFAAMALMLMLATTTFTTSAFADLASDKAAVDAAKASGTVGEQADGYLGIVSGAADAAVTAAVADINTARGDVYAQTAAKSGVTRDAAGQATGAQLLEKAPAGQFIKPIGGGWTKK